ncbi:hypothetical protein AC249_AIPGENE9587, partial [Exaiptasia diaphana]
APNSTDLLVMLESGWREGSSYRVRLSTGLRDSVGRNLGDAVAVDWSVPPQNELGVAYDQRFNASFDNVLSASNTLGGRFPGGQTSLFQGLWTDPVSGLSYARARWYDARNVSWMSEDPLADVDSPNMYAFVSWAPNMGTDPLGQCWGKLSRIGGLTCADWGGAYVDYLWSSTTDLGAMGLGIAKGTANLVTLGKVEGIERAVEAYQESEGTLSERIEAANDAYNEGQLDYVTLGFYSAEDKGDHAKQLVKDSLGVDAQVNGIHTAVEGATEGDWDKAIRGGAEWLGGASQTVLTVATLGETATGVQAVVKNGGPKPKSTGGVVDEVVDDLPPVCTGAGCLCFAPGTMVLL